MVLDKKIINKSRSTKNQENSTQSFGDNYLTNHLVKFLQDMIKPWGAEALRLCTGYHVFKTKIVSWGFLTFFDYSQLFC